jgi:hypothetical protein
MRMCAIYVVSLCNPNKLTHRFDKTAKLAGKDWANQFRKKHNLSLRQPEKTSVARAMGFNRVQVDLFFNNLRRMYEKYKFNPHQIQVSQNSRIKLKLYIP